MKTIKEEHLEICQKFFELLIENGDKRKCQDILMKKYKIRSRTTIINIVKNNKHLIEII